MIDFGTSHHYDKNNGVMTQMYGTPYYIAPEVLKQSYDTKCDVWSAGVLMYILLSGKPPFDGSNNQEILKEVVKGQPSFTEPIWQMISPEGIDFLKKILERD